MGGEEQKPSLPSDRIDWNRQMVKLSDVFNRACRLVPELGSGKPLGMGAFGMAVAEGDSVTKLIFNKKTPIHGLDLKSMTLSEVNNLRLMRDYCDGRKIGGLDVPILMREPQYIEGDKDFLMAFEMSRVSGHSIEWFDINFMNKPLSENVAHFESAGQALAQFHAAAAKIPFEPTVMADWRAGAAIPRVPHFSDHLNKGLEAADRYLKAHAVAGVAHGDFHCGNFLVDEAGKVSGLIDFSMTGQSANIFGDFTCIPKAYIKHFSDGYREAGGTVPSREMLIAINLGWMANMATVMADDPEAQVRVVQNINESLNQLTFVTGHKP